MKDSHKETLRKVRDITRQTLKELVQQALRDSLGAMAGQSGLVHDQDARLLMDSQQTIVESFLNQISDGFDNILGERKVDSIDSEFGMLSLMEENELESVIALEGMITHARNCDITEYLRFSTRLNDLFYGQIIDETNNPLDPAQIGEAIKFSIEDAGLSSESQLGVYRKFNHHVFHNLESVLKQANEILKNNGVLPGLDISGRDKEDLRTRRCNSRKRVDPIERAFKVPTAQESMTTGNRQEAFAVMQSLLHKDVHKVVTSSHVHDSIEVTDLLFRAIWDDVTVPEAIRRLLGRTSLTVLKVALYDKTFWNEESHPARKLLNELAEARSRNFLIEEIENDPVFLKAREVVSRFVSDYEDDNKLLAELVRELHECKLEFMVTEVAEDASRKQRSCYKRLEEARSRAGLKIKERIGNRSLPDCVHQLLERHFKNFLVEVILAQGTGGDSWKPIMKTIDLLIWSVQPGKSEQDREKLQKVNIRLMSNLKKTLLVAKVGSQEIDNTLLRIREAQDSSFNDPGKSSLAGSEDSVIDEILKSETHIPQIEPDERADERYLREATALPLGTWMEFVVDGSHSIKCTLAAKISDRGIYVFVNKQGVKVVEKSVAGLAKELEENTARLVNDNVLIDRAIDTVIARLRARNEKRPRLDSEMDSAA